MENLLQRSRFELKYLVDEARARAIRDFTRTYLAPDPFAKHDYGYPIYSIYLDNPKLDLLRATVEAHKNRFKLRARFYDDKPDSPVYFEIKRRVNGAILKDRAKVRRDAAVELLHGARPDRWHLVNEADSDHYGALRRFCELRDKIQAVGRCVVAYDREAWLTPDNNSARLTFDRNVHGGPYDPTLSVRPTDQWVRPKLAGVVLELKFTDRYPNWMRDLTQIFNLERCSMAKYVKCLNAMGSGPARPVRPARTPEEITLRKLLAT